MVPAGPQLGCSKCFINRFSWAHFSWKRCGISTLTSVAIETLTQADLDQAPFTYFLWLQMAASVLPKYGDCIGFISLEPEESRFNGWRHSHAVQLSYIVNGLNCMETWDWITTKKGLNRILNIISIISVWIKLTKTEKKLHSIYCTGLHQPTHWLNLPSNKQWKVC